MKYLGKITDNKDLVTKEYVDNVDEKIGDLTSLSTTNKTSVVEALNETFQSVSNGKAAVASAITDKGVTTASDATFATMAGNIRNNLLKPTGNRALASSPSDQTNIDVAKYSTVSISAIARGVQGTPTATKSINGTTATVTPSCTDTTGYITGTTKQGTGVTVTAAELATLGTKSISDNDNNIDVVGYSKVNVNIPFVTIHPGTGSPDNNLGVNGDIYLDLG